MFTKKKEIDKEIIHNDGTIEFNFNSKQKVNVKIKGNRIDISFSGVNSAITKGLSGTKTMNLKHLIGIQFKEPGNATTGYLQMIYAGIHSSQGLTNAVKDEDSIVFDSHDLDIALDLRDYLLAIIFK